VTDNTIICVTRPQFADDVSGRCGVCFRLIYFRPHSAHISRRICWPCGRREMEETGQAVPEVTEASRAEMKRMGVDVNVALAYFLSRNAGDIDV
jgi:hypothetical protein